VDESRLKILALNQEPEDVPAPVDPKPLRRIVASPWLPVEGLHPAAFRLTEGALGSQGAGAVWASALAPKAAAMVIVIAADFFIQFTTAIILRPSEPVRIAI
jgi:hypothetical protein